MYWDNKTGILFIMNGGDGHDPTAYYPLIDTANYEHGTIVEGTPAYQGVSRPGITLENYQWDRVRANNTAFFECDPASPLILHTGSGHNMSTNSFSAANRVTGMPIYVNYKHGRATASQNPPYDSSIVYLRPFHKWGSVMVDSGTIYMMGPGDDINHDGTLGNGVVPSSTNPDQGLHIWAYSMTWNKPGNIDLSDTLFLDSLFAYRFPSLHTPENKLEDCESYLELDDLSRNKAWLINKGDIWAAWKPSADTSVQLIHCNQTMSETFDLGVCKGMFGVDIWPHISLANWEGNQYIVYHAANAYHNDYSEVINSGYALDYDHIFEPPRGDAQIALFDVNNKNLKWTYNISTNYPDYPLNYGALYIDKTQMVVAGKTAFISWLDLTDSDSAYLKILSFDITASSPAPVMNRYYLDFPSNPYDNSIVEDIAAVEGTLYVLVSQSDTLCPGDYTIQAQHLFAFSNFIDTIPPCLSDSFSYNIKNNYIIVTWGEATDNMTVSKYNLYFDDDLVQSEMDAFYFVAFIENVGIPDKIRLEVLDAQGNKSDKTISLNLSGVHKEDERVYVYPNPVKNKLNIHVNSGINQIALYTIHGQIIEIHDNLELTKSHHIQTRKLKKGCYFLKIISDKKIYSKMIIKTDN
jgi:hypothetical protein